MPATGGQDARAPKTENLTVQGITVPYPFVRAFRGLFY